MAEAAMFSVAGRLVFKITSSAFKEAYHKVCSTRSARDDLEKLQRSIQTIQAGLLDAEKKQDSSAAVKIWIKRVRDVLYDAEDLFDEVATDDLLRKQIKGNNKLFKKVRAFASSSLNPIVSNNSIAKRVKDIRKSLVEICEDMKQFQFVECLNERPVYSTRKGQETGSFVDAKNVIGRDEDMKAVLTMLLDVSNDARQDVSVIAIVGIGGMGKTTLAQLVYNHHDVKSLENRWFACISDTSDDREVFGKIFHSICEGNYGDLSVSVLQSRIKNLIEGKKFMLVLDGVRDDDRGRWQDRLSLLSRGSKGSKIILTTRSLSVARAVGALEFETHKLNGLSEADSWNLFKRLAGFTPEHERDSRWTDIGKEIVKKCANVPLAIKSIASLLFEKNTIEEWESFRNEEIPKLGEGHKDDIMPVLKLSYEDLPSNLKHCFAYCALFPKDRLLDKKELIYQWISQGYVTSNNEKQTVEDVGHSYFMNLFRRSFFQDESDSDDYIKWYRMHDLIHDLAQYVAREENITLTTSSSYKIDGKRHVSAGCGTDGELIIPTSLHNVNLLRSFVHCRESRVDKPLILEKQFANYKLLRALSLPRLGIENIPSYIGELKHLRYLNISWNNFKILPDSITKLVNLCTLNITGCYELEVLPDDFRKLINLRHLANHLCLNLKHMPPGFEELTSLQHLCEFKVGKGIGGQRSRLDVLLGLKLKEQVWIEFKDDTDDWDGVECWQPPLTLEGLVIHRYRGMRLPQWSNGPSILPKLTYMSLSWCSRVKCLPPLRHIPNLNHLTLECMEELQYIQGEEEDEGKQSPKVTAGSNALHLPDLKKLELLSLKNLKGWWGKVEATTTYEDVEAEQEQEQHSSQLVSFPSLSHLQIQYCPKFNPTLLCPRLSSLDIIESGKGKMIQQLLSTHGNSSPSTSSTTITSTSSSSLESVTIVDCAELSSFPGESLTSLQRLVISNCNKLKEVHLVPSHLNILEELILLDCPELELWDEKKRGLDWDSLPNLQILVLRRVPSREKLPDCLRLRQDLGKLQIITNQFELYIRWS